MLHNAKLCGVFYYNSTTILCLCFEILLFGKKVTNVTHLVTNDILPLILKIAIIDLKSKGGVIMYILILAWILSPLALIPLTVKRSKENNKLRSFVDQLCRNGRISASEYINLRAEKSEKESSAQSMEASAPVFADSHEFSKIHGGASVKAVENNNTASDKNVSEAAVKSKPAEPSVKDEVYKNLYDLPVYSYQKMSSGNAQPAPQKSESKADNAEKPTVPAAVKHAEQVNTVKNAAEKSPYFDTKPVRVKAQNETGKNKAAAMSVLMMIGIIFVILAGLVFSTAVWATLGEVGRTLAIGTVAALFFGVSAFTGKKVKLERTSFAFYILGTFFSAMTLLTAGFFGIMGRFFSVTGEGSYLLYAAALIIISLFTAKGRSIFDIHASAYISVFSGAFAAVLVLVQLSDSMGLFALLAAIFTAVINIFMYALNAKISDKWEKPLRIASAVLNAIALIGGISAAFGGTAAFYAAAVIFILRSIAAAVMGFKEHRIYKTGLAAVSSLGSGAFFALLLMFKLSESTQVFALSAAVFAVLFAFGMFTFNIRIPEGWNVPVKMSAFILNAVGVISSFYTLMQNFGEWDSVCFAVAAIYIISSFAAGIMAVTGHSRYSEAPSAFASMFTGLAFAVMLVSELSSSTAITALCLTVMLLVLVNALYTIPSKLPENWKLAADVSTAILGLISVFGTLFVLVDNFGNWDAACCTITALYILQAVIITAAAHFGHEEYSKGGWAVISQLSGTFFTVLTLAQIAESEISFMLYLTIFAAVYLNFVHTFELKRPESWGTPLKVFSYLLGIFGVIFTLPQMFYHNEWTYHFYVTIAIYIAYSIGITVMAFFKHGEYSKTHWAIVSQITGISFIIILLANLAVSEISFMLYLTIFAVIYLNFVHSFGLKKPEKWEASLKVFSYFLGIFGVVFTACQMIDCAEWNYHFYVTAAIYIAYSIAITVMAFFQHGEYSKTHWAIISQITGISFIIILLAKLAVSEISFMLYQTIFAVAYLNFVHTFGLKKPEKWEASLKVFSYLLGLFGIIFTACQMYGYSEWTYHFYLSAAIYIAYSIGITAMAFFKHGEYSKTNWAVISQITGILLSLSVLYKLIDGTEIFVFVFSAFAVLYSAAVYFSFMKMPEKWVRVTNVTDIIFNIAAAVSAAVMLKSEFGSWDIYCFMTAVIYIAYTAVRGIRSNNSFLKAAECFISSMTAYNMFCVFVDENFAVPEFLLVCMMFAIAMIHHFAKPIRTVFSDIFLTAGLAVSALACAFEYNLCGIIGFAMLGAVMLIKSAEDRKISNLFKILLPLPVTGIVFTFVYYNFANLWGIADLFDVMLAANAAVLTVIAAAIMFIRKRTDLTFWSFGLTASVLVFNGAASGLTGIHIILLAVSIMLTVLFCRCRNNLPSLITMTGSAAMTYCLAETASLYTDFNVSLLFAAMFAMVSLAASRIFYSKKIIDREDGKFRLDTCCAGILLALPMVHSADEKVTAFAVLSILAAFAANLFRKENKGDANRVALTVACGLFAIALIFRPFLIASDVLFSQKITLGIISLFGFAFSKIWSKYPKLSENFSSAVYGISFVCLIIDALSHQNLFNTLIVLGVSALILLYSFISKKKRWFAVSSVSLLGLTIYTFRDFFTMIDWRVYLLIVGLILIAVSAANEYFVRKGREFKEKAGRFFEDWKW